MSQYVGDIGRDDLPRAVEVAGGGVGWRASRHQIEAFQSCARQLGLPIEVVLRASERGLLGELIEARMGRRTESRSRVLPALPGFGTRDPERVLEVLSFKRHAPR